MTRHILVIGETGQLARALKKEGQSQGLPLKFSNRSALNLEAPARVLKRGLAAYGQVRGIILAAAYTDVDGAETDEKTAQMVNGVAPATVASFCKKKTSHSCMCRQIMFSMGKVNFLISLLTQHLPSTHMAVAKNLEKTLSCHWARMPPFFAPLGFMMEQEKTF